MSLSASNAGYGRLAVLCALAILTVSLGLNVVLGWRVRSLQNAVLAPRLRFQVPRGTRVAAISVSSVDGARKTVTLAGYARYTVLYVLRPGCAWCERNRPNIVRLAATVGRRYRFVGVSLTSKGFRDFARSHSLGFPLYAGLSPAIEVALRLGVTPETIVFTNQGRVIRSWNGAYGSVLLPRVEAYFHISLPGLTSDSGTPTKLAPRQRTASEPAIALPGVGEVPGASGDAVACTRVGGLRCQVRSVGAFTAGRSDDAGARTRYKVR